MKELRIQVETAEDLKRYLYSTAWGVLSLPVFSLLSWYLFSHIFSDGAFMISDLKDWSDLIWFLVCLGVTLWLGYTFFPIWWHRYVRRPVLMCFYNREKKEFYDYKIMDNRSAKRILVDLPCSNYVIWIGLPLYGLWQFRWGQMVWNDNQTDCRYWVRIRSIMKSLSKLDIEAVTNVDLTDGKNFLHDVSLHWLPRIAFQNSNQKLSEVITRLAMSQEQEEKTLKELFDLKDTDREKWNALMGIGKQAIMGLRTIVTSTRLHTSDEAGEVGERFGVILEYVKRVGEGFADKDVLKARAEWEASDVKKRLDRRRALRASDEDEKLKLEGQHKRRRVARTK